MRSYLTGYSLVSNQQVAELTTDLPYDVSLKRLEKGLSKLNIPMPDTAYATMKSALILEKNNYSLFDIDKTIAYYIMGMLKSIESEYALNYIYETEDICATYHVSPSEAHKSTLFLAIISLVDIIALETHLTSYIRAVRLLCHQLVDFTTMVKNGFIRNVYAHQRRLNHYLN